MLDAKRLGDLETQRFRKEPGKDKFTQYALTVEGKVGNFDITYAGAYMRRPTYSVGDYTDYADAYDAYYESAGGLANYFYFQDSAGNNINPTQYSGGSRVLQYGLVTFRQMATLAFGLYAAARRRTGRTGR